jgi:hypothetical protein
VVDIGGQVLLRYTLVHAFDNMVVENTFSRVTGGDVVPQDEAETFASVLSGSAWMDGRSDAMTLTRLRVEDLDPGLAATGEVIFAPPIAGTDSSNASPPLCALLVQWRGLAKGKNGRGRMYLCGYPASTAIAGFWTSDAQDPASASASVIFDIFGPDGDGTLCIANRKRGGVPLVPPETTLINSFTVDNVIRRIGRREVGRGI